MRLYISDIETATECEEGAIWGNIYLQINDIYFPDNAWYDSVSSILHMWATELIEFIQSKKKQCCLFFMDGPFLLKLSKIEDSSTVLISCTKTDGTVVTSSNIRLSTFIKIIVEAAHGFLNACQRKEPQITQTRIYTNIMTACLELEEYSTE